jgi:dual specificity tyrosine-phosphorylation-regulated kinase 2/3/4
MYYLRQAALCGHEKELRLWRASTQGIKRDLAEYKLKEILLYREVYNAAKIYTKLKALCKDAFNNGFDDKKGLYLVNEHDHLANRYEIISLLGNGSFGHVYNCLDYKANELVAIKILINKEKFRKHGQIKIYIIKMLSVTSREKANSLWK